MYVLLATGLYDDKQHQSRIEQILFYIPGFVDILIINTSYMRMTPCKRKLTLKSIKRTNQNNVLVSLNEGIQ